MFLSSWFSLSNEFHVRLITLQWYNSFHVCKAFTNILIFNWLIASMVHLGRALSCQTLCHDYIPKSRFRWYYVWFDLWVMVTITSCNWCLSQLSTTRKLSVYESYNFCVEMQYVNVVFIFNFLWNKYSNISLGNR